MHQEIPHSSMTITRVFWFITRTIENDLYYLKKFKPERHAAYWCKDCKTAAAFMNKQNAKEYKREHFTNRYKVKIVKHELCV